MRRGHQALSSHVFRWMLPVAFLLSAPHAAAGGRGYWIEAAPANATEAAIRDALAKNAFAGAEATASALIQIAAGSPGTPAAGLARLEAGLELLAADQPDAALAALRHDDVAAAELQDLALFAIARALETKKDKGAGAAFLAAVDARPDGPLVCTALLRGAESGAAAGDAAGALAALQRTMESCPDSRSRALLEIGRLHEAAGSPKAAAAAFDQLDREFPASPHAQSAEKALRALAVHLPVQSPAERSARSLAKAVALLESGQSRSALPILRLLRAQPLAPAEADRVKTKLGRAYLALKRPRDAEAELGAVRLDSPHGGEAAFYRARAATARTNSPDEYETVAKAFAGTAWGEEALLSLANHYQKDARDDEALPYYRRLLDGYPEGRHFDRAAWRVGWGDFRAGRYTEAAATLERVARLKPKSPYSAGMLYWAGRAKQAMGDTPSARALLQEVVIRYKNSYHGLRARDALLRLPRGAALVALSPAATAASTLPEPQLTRVKRLLLIGRLDAAYDEVRRLPQEPLVQATLAYIDHRRGRLRAAIVSMKRAYPEWISEAGDRLPEEVWRILYPIDFDQLLREKAAEESLDAALVASLICQESTFNPEAVSSAGARGLMQVIPPTGRTLARQLQVRYRSSDLLKPTTSLDFGTFYLRQLLDRFGGRVELVLAAYNAGPHRVDAWTAGRPDIPDEEFVESIPFTETRHYVMTVLANREHYRRLYGLGPAPEAASVSAGVQ